MILSARCGTGVVLTTTGHALIAVFGTLEVGYRLAVLRGVWRDAVRADAVVGEGCWVTIICIRGSSIAFRLKANQWTLCDLALAPCIYSR